MKYVLAAVMVLICAIGVRAQEVREPADIPFEKVSLGMKQRAVEALGAEPDADGDLVASVRTGDQAWLSVLSVAKGKVTQFSMAALADTAHFEAAVEAIGGQGYVPIKICLDGMEVELLALGADEEAAVKRRALWEEFRSRAPEANGPAAAVFLRNKDFAEALKLSPAEVAARLAEAPAYLLRHKSDGMTTLVCTDVASMTRPVEPEPAPRSDKTETKDDEKNAATAQPGKTGATKAEDTDGKTQKDGNAETGGAVR